MTSPGWPLPELDPMLAFTSACAHQQPHDQAAHPQLVARAEQHPVLAYAIDQDPVRAPEVLHIEAIPLEADERVSTRDGGLVEHEIGVPATPSKIDWYRRSSPTAAWFRNSLLIRLRGSGCSRA